MSTGGATAERRRRIATRAAPLIVVATLAFAGGMVIAVEPDAPAAQRFVDAWERGDTAAMYAELTPDVQEEYSLPHFRQIYDDAATQSTLAELSAGDVSEQGDDAVIPSTCERTCSATLAGSLELPLSDGKVDWAPNLVYPGLAPGRAAHPAHQGAAARGDPRRRPHPARLGAGVGAQRRHGRAGRRGRGRSPSRAQAEELEKRGFPPGTLDRDLRARARLQRPALRHARAASCSPPAART